MNTAERGVSELFAALKLDKIHYIERGNDMGHCICLTPAMALTSS